MSPATAAPAMSAFDVFIWFFGFLLLSFSFVAVIHLSAQNGFDVCREIVF